MAIIIGIDPGTRVTGYGVIRVEGSTYRAIDFGCIRPPTDLPLFDRYLAIFNAIEALIEEFPPDAVAVETQFVSKNVKSAMMVAMARCAAVLAARRKGVAVYEYAPLKAKKAVVGIGTASKKQVQGMVQLLLQLEALPTPEDAADALALAICHAQAINFQQLRSNYV